MSHFIQHYGAGVVFGVLFLEVVGLPFIPGETALVAAAVLAQRGHLSIVTVIVAAVSAAILGAAAGYGIGRWQGRRLVGRFGPRSVRALHRSEQFVARHGGKAVFFARFAPVLRSTIGVVAGLGRMGWWRFLFWNAAGGLVWGLAIGLGAYYAGEAAVAAAQRYGAIGIGAVIAALLLAFFGIHRWRRRFETS